MEPITYEQYRTNPKIREQIEKEVRHSRAQAAHQYIVIPIKALFIRSESKTGAPLVVRAA